MKLWNRIMKDESGVLTFEWILLLTVLVIGLTGGLSAVRDALLTELGDVMTAIVALDQSYYIIAPWEMGTPDKWADGATWSYFRDNAYVIEGRTYYGDGANAGALVNNEEQGYKPGQTITADGPKPDTGFVWRD